MPMLAAVAIGALATGAAVAEGIAVATALTYVGVGMSVVGAVTGNQNFAKVGALMGVAGGIGGAFGAAGEAGVAEGASASAYSDVAGEKFAESAGQDAAGSGFETAMGGTTTAPVDLTSDVSAVSSPTGAPAQAPVAPADAESSKGLLSSTATPATPPADAAVPIANTQATPVTGSVDAAPTPSAAENPNVTMGDPMATGVSPTPPSDTSPGGMRAWWKSLGETQKTEFIKAGASGVGALFNGWSAEQKLAFEREQAALTQANVVTKQTNLNAQPTVAFTPVAGYPTRQGILGASRG